MSFSQHSNEGARSGTHSMRLPCIDVLRLCFVSDIRKRLNAARSHGLSVLRSICNYDIVHEYLQHRWYKPHTSRQELRQSNYKIRRCRVRHPAMQ